jgi:hypothetical protein
MAGFVNLFRFCAVTEFFPDHGMILYAMRNELIQSSSHERRWRVLYCTPFVSQAKIIMFSQVVCARAVKYINLRAKIANLLAFLFFVLCENVSDAIFG